MRRLDFSNGHPPVEEIENWIRDKGLSAFRRKPKDGQGNPLTGNRLITAMAWGIVKKKKGRIRNKRKAIGKGTEDLLQNLISVLRRGYVDLTVDEIISSLQNETL